MENLRPRWVFGGTFEVWCQFTENLDYTDLQRHLTHRVYTSSFKVTNIAPIYKGKGKHPLNPNSYRGIGVSNVLSKLFESLTLSQMLPELMSKGFPSTQQTAYQHGISCEDATVSVNETQESYTK